VPILKPEIRTIVVEAAIVVIVGLGIALTANVLSPRGLALSRNYFPGGTNPVPAAPGPVPAPPVLAATNEPSASAQLSERLRGKGLQELQRSQAEILFHDPRDQDGRIVFVDARDEDHYQQGHIPGAYELDPYHPEKELGTVLPVCQAAEEVVVYCTGGECEDSDTAAILLRDGGVPGRKLFVYGGGFTEWAAAHLPVETGPGNSGMQNESK
jgi:rhodanese-related sulfurtransferase